MTPRAIGLLLLGLVAGAAPAQTLRMSYGGSWTLPWGQLAEGKVLGGINPDIGRAVAQKLGMKVEFVLLPQRREHEEQLARPYDLGCGLHPSWIPNPERYHWSQPLFEVSDRLVGHRDREAVHRAADLPVGTVVGTVRSYRYPTLQTLFESGQLKRADALDQEGALHKLSRRRTDVAVVSQQVLDWYRARNPSHELANWSVLVQSTGYHCVVSPSSPHEPRLVLEALHTLAREGEIQRILARYAPASR